MVAGRRDTTRSSAASISRLLHLPGTCYCTAHAHSGPGRRWNMPQRRLHHLPLYTLPVPRLLMGSPSSLLAATLPVHALLGRVTPSNDAAALASTCRRRRLTALLPLGDRLFRLIGAAERRSATRPNCPHTTGCAWTSGRSGYLPGTTHLHSNPMTLPHGAALPQALYHHCFFCYL